MVNPYSFYKTHEILLMRTEHHYLILLTPEFQIVKTTVSTAECMVVKVVAVDMGYTSIHFEWASMITKNFSPATGPVKSMYETTVLSAKSMVA